MTELELAALREEARESLARRDFGAFCERMDPNYIHTKHGAAIIKHLNALAAGEIMNLMVFMPPRYGKTYHDSERFPAFFQGINGGKVDVILASYTIDRARASSRKARALFRETTWPFQKVRLDPFSQAVDEWRTSAGGVVKAAGVGGSMTGFGAHLLDIDDPIKGRAEADSETMRESAWEWYTEVARTRLMKGARQLFTTTRWHEDDVAGRILDSGGASDWTILELPLFAICATCGKYDGSCGHDALDAIGRKPGELLAPKLGLPVPSVAKGEITSRGFFALYQQRPQAEDGSVFRKTWFEQRYQYGNPPEFTRRVAWLDGAWKDGVQNDRSALSHWGVDEKGEKYLIDAWAGRFEYPDLRALVIEWYEYNRPEALLVEDAASGTPLIQELRRSTNIPIIGIPPRGSKIARAEAVTPQLESGRVHLPDGAPWLEEWIQEHLKFPVAAHDDWVDCTSGALGYLAGGGTYNFGSLRARR
jgi:predicted phage terminase large subunit-like protein